MIKIYDTNMRLAAILQNAYGISYEKRLNEIWAASFSLPADDPKTAECLPFRFVEIFDGAERVELFRILPTSSERSSDGKTTVYECEHVLATLMDDILFDYHERVGLNVASVLEYILDAQENERWTLGQCDFTDVFSYKWENDNLLGALFSVPKPFIDDWQFTWDTSVYPWELNLIAPSPGVQTYIRYRKNLVGIKKKSDPTQICTRLYALGYGEGVNQLKISSVNPSGLPYVEDAAAVAQYGVISRVWVDRRYERADSLYNAALAQLNALKDPYVTYEVSAADLYRITQDSSDKFEIGSYVRAIDEEMNIDIVTRVVRLSKNDVEGAPGDISIEIANKVKDIGGTVADLADRQRINDVYAQGATNLDTRDFADNCDPTHPAKIKFWLPAETARINKMSLTYETAPFRAYSKAVTNGNSYTIDGNGATKPANNLITGGLILGGYITGMIKENDAAAASTSTDGVHGHGASTDPGGDPEHTHGVNIGPSGSHSHTVTIPAHTHEITNHSHYIDHDHEIEYGIYEGPEATSLTIEVDGNVIAGLGVSGEDIDIIPYLSKNGSGQVERGQWHEIIITPNSNSRIVANVVSQIFVQSRGGGDY
jgi:phage minor structural protein